MVGSVRLELTNRSLIRRECQPITPRAYNNHLNVMIAIILVYGTSFEKDYSRTVNLDDIYKHTAYPYRQRVITFNTKANHQPSLYSFYIII